MLSAPGWSIVVHGGAKPIADHEREAHRSGCTRAVEAGQEVLTAGGDAVVAVEAAIRVLEDDPTFNAGYGSVLNADGVVECDAAVMDGQTLDVGAVAGVRGIRHPVTVAAALLREKPVLLVADGAERFARAFGAEFGRVAGFTDPATLIIEQKRDALTAGSDTVGCVARDIRGHIAAGTSTGGLTGSLPGRVGDSPLPGCGLYAEDAAGGVSLSGTGEHIIRTMLAARLMHLLETGPAEEALEKCLDRLAAVGGDGGLIVIDATGRVSWAHNSPDFAVAFADSFTPVQAHTRRGVVPSAT